MSSGMTTLPPAVAASFAAIAYETLSQGTMKNSEIYTDLEARFTFNSSAVQGISGSILERISAITPHLAVLQKEKQERLKIIMY